MSIITELKPKIPTGLCIQKPDTAIVGAIASGFAIAMAHGTEIGLEFREKLGAVPGSLASFAVAIIGSTISGRIFERMLGVPPEWNLGEKDPKVLSVIGRNLTANLIPGVALVVGGKLFDGNLSQGSLFASIVGTFAFAGILGLSGAITKKVFTIIDKNPEDNALNNPHGVRSSGIVINNLVFSGLKNPAVALVVGVSSMFRLRPAQYENEWNILGRPQKSGQSMAR